MSAPMLALDAGRLLEQICLLGAIGADAEQGGRTRIALTDDDKAGRDLLVRWMRELGLDVRVDRIGNLFGILHAATDAGDRQPLMIGSHIDTVRNAGALDGCYGVLSGLAVARAYRASGAAPARAIVVGAFTNEEGVRFQPDMMGSLVYAGALDAQAALDTVGTDGARLGDELARIGYAGDMEPGAAPDTTLATVGSLRLEPDLINVIARKATFTVDMRDPDEQRLQAAEKRLADFLAQIAGREGVSIETERLARFTPVAFEAGLINKIEASARRLGFSHRRMTSGAGHDAQMIARIAPAAMIFVPSRGGISHNPREHTDDEQLAQGAQVLLDVVRRRLASA